MGVLTLFSVFFFGGGLSPFFWKHWALPKRSITLDCQLKNRNSCAPYGPPFQFIYLRDQLWANHMGKKCGAIGNVWGNKLGTLGRTLQEHIGNMMGTRERSKKFFPHFPQRK